MTDSTIIKSHKFIDGVKRVGIELLQGEIREEKNNWNYQEIHHRGENEWKW